MKQRSLILISAIAGLVIIFFALSSELSLGPKIEVSGNVVLPKNEVFVGTYIRAADDVEINGTIEGDAFIVAQNITINGMVRGNVYLAGSNVNINSNIGGAVHAVAQNVNIDGNIDQNIISAGMVVNIGSGKEGQRVGGGVMVAGNVVKINSFVGSDLFVAGENLIINSEIRGNANLAGDEITLGKNTLVDGGIKYIADDELAQEEGSKIVGSVEKISNKFEPNTFEIIKRKTVWALFGLLSTLLLGAVLLWYMPKTTRDIALKLKSDYLKSLGIGWLFVITVPFLALLLFSILLGIKLALILVFVYVAVLLSGSVFVAYAIGDMILPTQKNNNINGLSALLIGLIVLGVVNLIPIVNVLVALLVMPAGIGILVSRIKDGVRSMKINEQKALKAKA